jgi:hypothetical protein
VLLDEGDLKRVAWDSERGWIRDNLEGDSRLLAQSMKAELSRYQFLVEEAGRRYGGDVVETAIAEYLEGQHTDEADTLVTGRAAESLARMRRLSGFRDHVEEGLSSLP